MSRNGRFNYHPRGRGLTFFNGFLSQYYNQYDNYIEQLQIIMMKKKWSDYVEKFVQKHS